MTEIAFRIVQKVRTVTGIIRFAGTVDETDREDISAIVRTVTTTKSLDQIKRLTAATLELYSEDLYEGDNQEYLYYLQILQDGTWRTVKQLYPGRYPDSDDDYDDEDPLKGDLDDGSNYVAPANPLTTQHFFALKNCGEI